MIRENCVNFDPEAGIKSPEIRIGSVNESSPVFDLDLMIFSRFELNFPLQIDIPCSEDSLARVGIHGAYRHIQFRTVRDDLIG